MENTRLTQLIINFNLEEVMKAQWGSSGIATLFL